MSRFPVLTVDTATEVFKHLSIGDAESFVKANNDPTALRVLAEAMQNRTSITRHLSTLTSEPMKLMELMLTTRAFLAGSRAVDFFFPGFAKDDSDWNFYCPSDPNRLIPFIVIMESLGVAWDHGPQSNGEYHEGAYEYMAFMQGSIKDKGGNARVTLTVFTRCEYNVLDHLSECHSSIAQCFISGFAAVSLYDTLTSHGLSLRWPLVSAPITPSANHEAGPACIHNYVNRGVRYITYESFRRDEHKSTVVVSGKLYDITKPVKHCKAISRSVGDADTRIVKFQEHVDPEYRKLSGLSCSVLRSLAWEELPSSFELLEWDSAVISIPSAWAKIANGEMRLAIGNILSAIQKIEHSKGRKAKSARNQIRVLLPYFTLKQYEGIAESASWVPGPYRTPC